MGAGRSRPFQKKNFGVKSKISMRNKRRGVRGKLLALGRRLGVKVELGPAKGKIRKYEK